MRQTRLLLLAGFAALLLGPAQAGPARFAAEPAMPASPVVQVGERERAAAVGAIVGGAAGVLLGTALGQAAAPPPGPSPYAPQVVEEAEEVVVRRPRVVEEDEEIVVRRPVRRMVEIEEREPPRIVEAQECLTRRTRFYDPETGRTVLRKERTCR